MSNIVEKLVNNLFEFTSAGAMGAVTVDRHPPLSSVPTKKKFKKKKFSRPSPSASRDT